MEISYSASGRQHLVILRRPSGSGGQWPQTQGLGPQANLGTDGAFLTPPASAGISLHVGGCGRSAVLLPRQHLPERPPQAERQHLGQDVRRKHRLRGADHVPDPAEDHAHLRIVDGAPHHVLPSNKRHNQRLSNSRGVIKLSLERTEQANRPAPDQDVTSYEHGLGL